MLKWLVPVLIGLALVGLLVFQLIGEGAAECRVCVTFKELRECATAKGPSQAAARLEAQNSACSRLASGVTDSIACPNVPPDEVVCR